VPGIDFDRLRAEAGISTQRVLQLLGFEPERRRGGSWHGRRRLPACRQSRRASLWAFWGHVDTGRYCCHRCQGPGQQLELWSAINGLPLRAAAIDLCNLLGREVSWIHTW
jgi:hypothetical protein